MIRQLIIPGIITGAAHAFLLFTPPDNPPPPEPAPTTKIEVLDLGELPVVPPEPEKGERSPVDVRDLRPDVPFIQDLIMEPINNPFVAAFNPTMPRPDIKGNTNMVIPPGNYAQEGKALGEGVRLFNLIDLENKPRTLFQPAPDYPYGPKSRGEGGEVTVMFIVNENGLVEDVRVVKSSNPEFEGPTVRAVSKWRFEAGRKDGRRVKFRMSVPVAFNLADES